MKAKPLKLFMVFMLVALGQQSLSRAQTGRDIRGPRSEVGTEMRVIEEELIHREPPMTRSVEAGPALRDQLDDAGSGSIEDDREATGVTPGLDPVARIQSLVFRGDANWLEDAGAATTLRALLLGRVMSRSEIRAKVDPVQKDLVDRGFYLASLWVEQFDAEKGVVTIAVDAGRVGELRFNFGDRDDGIYFSRAQLERRMTRTKPGGFFYYPDFYQDVYGINVHPDLVMDTAFEVETRVEDDLLRREAHMNFDVEESVPLHAVMSLSNYGSDATDNWGASLTLQHLNLTRHDDVLTLSLPFSLDFESLRSGAASYSLPYYARKGGRLTAYGGYSQLDAQEVVEQIDIEGEGWFAGLQWSHNLVQNNDHQLSASAGFARRYIKDQLIVADVDLEPRDTTVMPYSLALSYTQVQPDSIGGRNMATLQLSYNAGDFLGTSRDDEIRSQRPAAEADYGIVRLQLARIQPLFGRVDASGLREGQWVLFAKAEGQLADGPLIPAEQIGIGGARTVRGYIEREFFGDDGMYANLELRTPLLLGPFSRFMGLELKQGQRYAADRVQGVFFVDGGYTRIQDPLPSEESSQNIFSAGLGLRVAVSDYTQFRFDWGFPFEATAESETSGAGYLELQIQF